MFFQKNNSPTTVGLYMVLESVHTDGTDNQAAVVQGVFAGGQADQLVPIFRGDACIVEGHGFALGYKGLEFRRGVSIHEGVVGEGVEKGEYGPYYQSHRKEIYHTVAKELVKNGLAYPCFCSEEELTALREKQEEERRKTQVQLFTMQLENELIHGIKPTNSF